ncbi:HipA domain-containing protein [Clavibacter sp. VKM Ac-2873]|uniref:HipA domain-containing protein n=1 Tax=Clavibacter sp. VKM Ac-2873 TaxID=2783813 RepID=UPI00188B2EEC|nr:HipA domain-containing protein [Clavibacter sp. VKM Ac-2873]MBF4618403.1 HipA domain-containing protein [Clavibacter sp. VKM Ac-2873]
MSTRVLDVYLYGRLAAKLERTAPMRYRLVYDAEWFAAGGPSISLSLPTLRRVHTGAPVLNFLDNLLPEDDAVRRSWSRENGSGSVEPFHLLSSHGADVAGALEFHPEGHSVWGEGSLEALTEAQIANRIRAIREDRDAGEGDGAPARPGQFSLAGAQGKFALAWSDGRWHEPTGVKPSTHIFKPRVRNLVDAEIVEHIIMTSAAVLGLSAASTEIRSFADQHSLVVARFDRHADERGSVTRIHQEDLVQALALPAFRKFEERGGPSVRTILELLDRIDEHELRARAKERFMKYLLFSWMVLNTDAHGKNYSLKRWPTMFDLAPIYDASSYLPYVSPAGSGSDDVLSAINGTHMASRLVDSHGVGDMGAFQWAAVGREAGLDGEAFLEWGRQVAAALPTVLSAVAGELESKLQTPVVELLLERIAARSQQVLGVLGRRIDV